MGMYAGVAVFALFIVFLTLIAVNMVCVCLGRKRLYHDLTGDKSCHVQDALTRRRK